MEIGLTILLAVVVHTPFAEVDLHNLLAFVEVEHNIHLVAVLDYIPA